MADDDLQLGITIEETGADQPQHVQAGLAVPPPSGGGQEIGQALVESAKVGLLHRLRWRRGMQIHGHVKALRRLPEGREARIVEEKAVRRSMNHRALESELV